MKALRWLMWASEALLLAAVVAVVGALTWLLATEEGLQWVIARVPQTSAGKVVIEGAHGSIARQISVDRVTFDREGLHVEATKANAAGNVFALLLGRVSVSRLDIESLTVRSSGEEPPSLPQRLSLPLGLAIGDARVERVEYSDASRRFEFHRLALAYEGGLFGHRVRSMSVETPWGVLALNGEIGGATPFPLSGAAAFSRPDARFPAGAGVELRGNLEHVRADVSGSFAGVSGRAKASIAPFLPERLQSLDAQLGPVNAARFGAGLPGTVLEAHVEAREVASGRLSGKISADNGRPGPLDRNLLPVASASARFSADRAGVRFGELTISLSGGATLTGAGEIRGEEGDLSLDARDLDLRALQSTLRKTELAGPLRLTWTPRGQSVNAALTQAGMSIALDAVREGDVIDFRSLKAEASGGKASGSARLVLTGGMPFQGRVVFSGLDPSRFGDYPSGTVNGSASAQGELAEPRRVQARWSVDDSQLLGRALTSQGSASLAGERISRIDAEARLGGNQASAHGAFGEAGDELAFVIDAGRIAELREGFSGDARIEGRISGGWANPTVSLAGKAQQLRVLPDIAARSLQLSASFGRSASAPFRMELSAQSVSVRGIALDRIAFRSSGTTAAHEADLSTSGTGFDFDVVLRGGWSEARGWSGQIFSLRNRGTYPLLLSTPANLDVSKTHATLGRLEASLGEGRLLVREVDWEPGRLSSTGEFRGLAAQWLIYAAGIAGRLESSLLLDGSWSLHTGDRLDGTLSVQRASGDLRLPGTTPIALGLQRLTVNARFDDGRLQARLEMLSRLGTISGRAELAPVADAPGLGFSGRSPLSFEANVDIAKISPVASLFITQARLDGRVNASLNGSGTLAAPQVSGAVAADDLSVAMPPYGVYLRGGRLRARLEGDTVQLSELRIQSGDGEFTASGSIPLHASEGGPNLVWQAHDFRLLERPDMRAVVSGEGAVKLGETPSSAGKLAFSGKLRANEGRFDLGQNRMPSLGDDVEVVGRPRPEAQATKVPVALDLNLDLGDQLVVIGNGFDGKIAGQLRLATSETGEPLAYGKLTAVNATFEAYGQRLQVDPGTLVFDGPIRNPALQITGWRRNQAVEAGVQLSGTLRNPQVQLVSNPPVPEGEKLSWLVLGRAPSEANRGDLGLLQSAAGALFARGNSVPATTRLARAFGFDELAFRGGSELSGRVVALGKRLSDRLYITYEQGLGTVASNLVKLDYLLTQRFSVRAETGTASALGLFYRYSWD